MKLRVTDDAKADLRQIKTFISERNAIAAEGVIDRIRKTLTLLAVLPRLGHRIEHAPASVDRGYFHNPSNRRPATRV